MQVYKPPSSGKHWTQQQQKISYFTSHIFFFFKPFYCCLSVVLRPKEEGDFPENLHRVVYVLINKHSFESFYVFGSYKPPTQHSLKKKIHVKTDLKRVEGKCPDIGIAKQNKTNPVSSRKQTMRRNIREWEDWIKAGWADNESARERRIALYKSDQ